MEMQSDQLRMVLGLFCIVLIWVLQRYINFARPLTFSERYTTVFAGALAGDGILRIMRISTFTQARDTIIELATAALPALALLCAVFVGTLVVEAVYKIAVSLVTRLKA